MQIPFQRSRNTRPTGSPTVFHDDATGFDGWRVLLEPGRAVPTPAIGLGRLFVGGGFGSYDFYALDAATGAQAWHQKTSDDGPTAAVFADGFVVFNTESCTLEVVEALSGRVVWEKWLGDPLLAQPAVMGDRIFMVFPKQAAHWLGAFALNDGRPIWETRLEHDVITAPIFAGGKVYLSTFDGTVWCVEPDSGRVNWSQQLQATSAPWVYENEIYVAHRDDAPPGTRQPGDPSRTRSSDQIATDPIIPQERTSRHDSITGQRLSSSSSKLAAYLSKGSGAARKAAYYAMDSSVGFAHSPGSAKLHTAEQLVGEGLVSRAWRFQGSRPVVIQGILYDTTGDRLEASDARTGDVLWSWQAAAAFEGERRLTPPAVANGRVWAGTWDGRIVSWNALTGDVRWEVKVGAPCHWQPVVSDGRVFAGLEDGSLVAFATGDSLDTGWPMWGGGCGHNGKPENDARARSTSRDSEAVRQSAPAPASAPAAA